MMNKKNLLKMMALGMAAAAVFGLAGCGGGSSSSQSAGSQTQKESPLMKKIKSSGKLVVGTASGYPPYEFEIPLPAKRKSSASTWNWPRK